MPTSDDLITTSVTHRDRVAVLSVGGEIDAATAPLFESAIATVLMEHPAALVIDLSAVDFMGSLGLRILERTKEKIGASVGFAIVAKAKVVTRPMQLIGLAATFSLCSTVENALATVREELVDRLGGAAALPSRQSIRRSDANG